jgi:8-oxo-dGTP diphosphatase
MDENNTPNAYYRVSIKALILDNTGKKFAVILEDNGNWELPGGGLDHGESIEDCLKRELKEEMGLIVNEIYPNPLYTMVGKNMNDSWSINIVFKIKVRDLNFTPTDECLELRFIAPEEIETINTFRNVKELAALMIKNPLI